MCPCSQKTEKRVSKRNGKGGEVYLFSGVDSKGILPKGGIQLQLKMNKISVCSTLRKTDFIPQGLRGEKTKGTSHSKLRPGVGYYWGAGKESPTKRMKHFREERVGGKQC